MTQITGNIIRWCNLWSTHLVLLEERATHVAVERVGEVVLEVLEARVEVVALLRVVDAHDEERDEPGERVLVHGVDVGQVGDREKEDGRVDGDRFVAHARRVDLLLRLLRNRLLLLDLVCQHLRAGQHFDGRLVLQDVSLRRRQHLENLVLDLLQFPDEKTQALIMCM